jgi:hypothetical protein
MTKYTHKNVPHSTLSQKITDIGKHLTSHSVGKIGPTLFGWTISHKKIV